MTESETPADVVCRGDTKAAFAAAVGDMTDHSARRTTVGVVVTTPDPDTTVGRTVMLGELKEVADAYGFEWTGGHLKPSGAALEFEERDRDE